MGDLMAGTVGHAEREDLDCLRAVGCGAEVRERDRLPVGAEPEAGAAAEVAGSIQRLIDLELEGCRATGRREEPYIAAIAAYGKNALLPGRECATPVEQIDGGVPNDLLDHGEGVRDLVDDGFSVRTDAETLKIGEHPGALAEKRSAEPLAHNSGHRRREGQVRDRARLAASLDHPQRLTNGIAGVAVGHAIDERLERLRRPRARSSAARPTATRGERDTQGNWEVPRGSRMPHASCVAWRSRFRQAAQVLPSPVSNLPSLWTRAARCAPVARR